MKSRHKHADRVLLIHASLLATAMYLCTGHWQTLLSGQFVSSAESRQLVYLAKHPEKVIDMLEKKVDAQPNDIRAWRILVQHYEKVGDLDKARHANAMARKIAAGE